MSSAGPRADKGGRSGQNQVVPHGGGYYYHLGSDALVTVSMEEVVLSMDREQDVATKDGETETVPTLVGEWRGWDDDIRCRLGLGRPVRPC